MSNNDLKKFKIGRAISLDPCQGWPKPAVHCFDRQQSIAVLAALKINRPLLIKGEPGSGKTQLARAVAQQLAMPLASLVVNERTEVEDLFWRFDALKRLSDANNSNIDVKDDKEYLIAGPLWWAINHKSAEKYSTEHSQKPDLAENTENPRSFSNRALLLIDEIDKADRSIPNSLLEALANYSFYSPHIDKHISCENPSENAPLIIITSNNEQQLPPAFVRRCLVLNIELSKDKDTFVAELAARGKAHMQGFTFESPDLFTDIATMLFEKRQQVSNHYGSFLPGQAEYFDHLEAIKAMKDIDPDRKEQDLVDELARLTYEKN